MFKANLFLIILPILIVAASFVIFLLNRPEKS